MSKSLFIISTPSRKAAVFAAHCILFGFNEAAQNFEQARSSARRTAQLGAPDCEAIQYLLLSNGSAVEAD